MNSSNEERNRITSDRLKLTEVEALIRDLENQLNAARTRREFILSSIERSEKIISENEKKIAEARSKIESLEKEIEALRDKADSIRRRCTELEIQLERLRTDLRIAEAKEDRINEQIDALNARIAVEEAKLVEDDLATLREMVERLSNLVPGIEREIDRQYYYCYGEGSVQVEQTGGVVVYIVRGESFGNYLLSVYGESVKAGNVRSGDQRLYRVNIFSAAYTSKFGYPFASSAFQSSDLSFNGDFSCLNHSALRAGQGEIRSISGNRITVATAEGDIELRMGACTRVECSKLLPEAAMKIAYRGVPSFAGGYNIYGATIW
jgi:predicted  nucleic acid-binding Zn-ribbon protein